MPADAIMGTYMPNPKDLRIAELEAENERLRAQAGAVAAAPGRRTKQPAAKNKPVRAARKKPAARKAKARSRQR